ncbi:uncharacterized protein YdaU (DUF1376 family) [Paraburkholderia sp. BL6665CI2N2]|uniref:YdaU family protein n=1 Tax=Paraburkholderia sp. BL6665CI2N2 TaxID=1938806 RepID=UPI0010667208|nr:YdaU family protein [Paraburkholderia sp. BL6665CI2N2]TDY23593.1 uncharacterized protein YdaU (DUF1376 family) [Paraburkholderia sp. BL6665CI2N2]
MNYYPHHIGDFDRATRHLTRIERSVYRDLIEVYYDTEQQLTLDVNALCRKVIARSEDEREAVNQILAEFFTKTAVGWHHSRCEKEIAVYRVKAEIAKENGKKGGRPRKSHSDEPGAPGDPGKTKPKVNGNQEKPSGFQSGSYQEPSGYPAETGSKANQQPVTNNQKVKSIVELALDQTGELFDEHAEEKPEEAESDPTDGLGAPSESKASESADIEGVFEYWRKSMNTPKSKLDDKRRGVIRRALKAGYSPRDLCRAIQGCSLTPYNQGDNDRGQKYLGIQVCLKDADQIDRFIANAKSPPAPSPKRNGGGAWWLSDASALVMANEVGVGPALSGESKETWHARIHTAIDNGGKPPASGPLSVTPMGVAQSCGEVRTGPSDLSRGTMAGVKALLKSKGIGGGIAT